MLHPAKVAVYQQPDPSGDCPAIIRVERRAESLINMLVTMQTRGPYAQC